MTTLAPSKKIFKKKQGFRLASFAPVLLPIARLPKPGFGNLIKKLVNFVRVVDIKST